jgi:hypothetical protein
MMELPIVVIEMVKSARLEERLNAAVEMAAAVKTWNETAICIAIAAFVAGCFAGGWIVSHRCGGVK